MDYSKIVKDGVPNPRSKRIAKKDSGTDIVAKGGSTAINKDTVDDSKRIKHVRVLSSGDSRTKFKHATPAEKTVGKLQCMDVDTHIAPILQASFSAIEFRLLQMKLLTMRANNITGTALIREKLPERELFLDVDLTFEINFEMTVGDEVLHGALHVNTELLTRETEENTNIKVSWANSTYGFNMHQAQEFIKSRRMHAMLVQKYAEFLWETQHKLTLFQMNLGRAFTPIDTRAPPRTVFKPLTYTEYTRAQEIESDSDSSMDL
jgi:hypothetical protein